MPDVEDTNLNKPDNYQNNNNNINKNSNVQTKKPITKSNEENLNKKNILSDSDSLSSSEDSGI